MVRRRVIWREQVVDTVYWGFGSHTSPLYTLCLILTPTLKIDGLLLMPYTRGNGSPEEPGDLSKATKLARKR